MVLRSLLRKTAVSGAISGSRAENTCCCSYCCIGVQKTEIWLGTPKHYRKYIAASEIPTYRGAGSVLFTMCHVDAHAVIV